AVILLLAACGSNLPLPSGSGIALESRSPGASRPASAEPAGSASAPASAIPPASASTPPASGSAAPTASGTPTPQPPETAQPAAPAPPPPEAVAASGAPAHPVAAGRHLGAAKGPAADGGLRRRLDVDHLLRAGQPRLEGPSLDQCRRHLDERIRVATAGQRG